MLAENIRSYSEEEKQQAWRKATVVQGYNPDKYRKDVAGAWIAWSKYGDRNSEYGLGWEIDHVKPVSKQGKDEQNNWRPLHWRNNSSKSDDYPKWTSVISSSGERNIYAIKHWIEQ